MKTSELDELLTRVTRLLSAGDGMLLMIAVMELRQERDRARDKLLALARKCPECGGEGKHVVNIPNGTVETPCDRCMDLREAAR